MEMNIGDIFTLALVFGVVIVIVVCAIRWGGGWLKLHNAAVLASDDAIRCVARRFGLSFREGEPYDHPVSGAILEFGLAVGKIDGYQTVVSVGKQTSDDENLPPGVKIYSAAGGIPGVRRFTTVEMWFDSHGRWNGTLHMSRAPIHGQEQWVGSRTRGLDPAGAMTRVFTGSGMEALPAPARASLLAMAADATELLLEPSRFYVVPRVRRPRGTKSSRYPEVVTEASVLESWVVRGKSLLDLLCRQRNEVDRQP